MNKPNAAQTTYWNDVAGPAWVELQEPMDRQLASLGRVAMAALAPAPGERVLDIGCGSGQTSQELAHAVEPGGSVMGIDLSAPLLALARGRTGKMDGVHFVQGDVQTFDFAPASFDAAFSRFGVMFFDDPVAAFRNVRQALRPGGRLAFICWRAWDENPMFSLPVQAAMLHLPARPPAIDPDAPGPFAFANADRVRGILADAGFKDVQVTPHDDLVGSGDLESALALSLKFGSLGAILRDDPSLREKVAPSVRAALAPHESAEGVKLPAAIWIVTAR